MSESHSVSSGPRPAAEQADSGTGRLADAARGWQRIQLAVLGFIGFCGVMWAGGDPDGPGWLQWTSGGLVVLGLVLACLSIYLVGTVAHPFPRGVPPPAGTSPTTRTPPDRAVRSLRHGVAVTYLAVVVVVVATLSAWWPGAPGTSMVEATDASGAAWCGQLRDAPAGAVRIDTTDGPVTLALRDVVTVRPVDGC